MPQLNVAFIGEPGSGKNVALGLLERAFTYAKAGQINEHNYSPDPEKTDWSYNKFNWNMGMDKPTSEYLKKHLSLLEYGEWPDALMGDYCVQLQFMFQRPSGIINGHGFLDKIRKPDETVLGIYQVAGEIIVRILDIISKGSKQEEIIQTLNSDVNLDALFRCDAFVFLINSEVCVPVSGEIDSIIKAREARFHSERDFKLALLLETIKNYKQQMGGTIRKIVFIFAKHDKVMFSLSLKTQLECENTLKQFLPVTFTVFDYIKQKYNLGYAFYCKSGIQTRENEEENRNKPDIPLRFYIHDYLALLDFLLKK